MDKSVIEIVNGLCFDIERDLVLAIIKTESGGVRGRTRYEPAYRYFHRVDYFANLIGVTRQTETIGQMTSHGMMQVMGSVFRELGYMGTWPEAGWDVAVGLKYGVMKFKQCFAKYGRDGGIAAYNAGTPRMINGKYVNQEYVDKVLKQYNILTKSN